MRAVFVLEEASSWRRKEEEDAKMKIYMQFLWVVVVNRTTESICLEFGKKKSFILIWFFTVSAFLNLFLIW